MDKLEGLPPPLPGRAYMNPVSLSEICDGVKIDLCLEKTPEYDLEDELMSDGELEAMDGIDYQPHHLHDPYKNTSVEVVNGEVRVIKKTKRVLKIDPAELLEPFEGMKKRMIDISGGDRGVLKEVLDKGNGIAITPGCRIYIHYYGTYEDADEPFDSTIGRKRCEMIDLNSPVLPGWQIAIQSMEVNEVARFIIAPDYMYGELGCPPRIPPNAELLFTVEVIKMIPKEYFDSVWFWSTDKIASMTFEEVYEAAKKLKANANHFYNQKQLSKAVRGYRRAAEVIEGFGNVTDDEDKQRDFILFQIYINLAQAYIKMAKWPQACVASKTALRIHGASDNPQYENLVYKAMFRFAEAKFNLGDTHSANNLNRQAAKLDPKNQSIYELQMKIDAKLKKEAIEERLLAEKMVGK